MKLRRAMAISAATTLVAGVALVAAPAALAAPAVSAAAVAAPKLGGVVSLKDFPATVAAGGAQITFTETVTNSGDDAVALPVVFLTSVGDLSTGQVKAQFQNPYTHKWVDAQVEGDGPDGPGVALILGSSDEAEPDENSVVFVPAGKSVNIQVRLNVTADAVAGAATAQPYAVLFPASESEQEPDGDGFLEGAKKAFTITAPGGTSASPSATAKPSASVSAAPSSTAKPSAPASSSAKPSASAPAKPSASAPSSTAPTAAPSGLPTKKPSATTVDEAKKQAQTSLASTGGGSDSTAIAATGAAALALGAGTLVLLRRRRTNTHRAK